MGFVVGGFARLIDGSDSNLGIPSRDEIMNSPVAENYNGQEVPRSQSPVMEDPSAALERELAGK